MSTRWNQLSADEKAVYTQRAQKAKEEYQQKYQEWSAKYGEEWKEQNPKVKHQKKPAHKVVVQLKKNQAQRKAESSSENSTKRTSAFFRFANDNRKRIQAKNPSASFGEITKILGEEWRKLSPDEKENMKKLSNPQKQIYQDESSEEEEVEEEEEESDDEESDE